MQAYMHKKDIKKCPHKWAIYEYGLVFNSYEIMT